jgi:hypothetical protein
MNKKLITGLLTLTMALPAAAHAAQLPTQPASIAILDTAIDDTLPIFQGKIADEVCMVDWTSCPNGKNFMEGPGAATMPANLINLNGFDHGTQMASILVANNPNIKIVFIKIIGNTATGQRQIAFESAVYNALNWVAANKDKFNIQAVTMAQGHHNLLTGVNYCPSTPKTQAAVKNLVSLGVPTFFPAGNGRDYQRLDWPACIPESVSVGAVDQIGEISSYSNNDPVLLDFFALGSMPAVSPGNIVKNVAGTSAAIQVAAAQWVLVKQSKPSISYSDELALLSSSAVSTIGRQGTFKKLINLQGALSG